MIDVATLSVIRRWALREHLSLREIARRTGLSRNTIKKYLRADTVEPRYAKRVSPSKLDPFADKLAGWLKTEAGKSRKQRRTVKQMHADLAALGYDGSYNRVAAFARVWQAKRQEAERTTGREPLKALSRVGQYWMETVGQNSVEINRLEETCALRRIASRCEPSG